MIVTSLTASNDSTPLASELPKDGPSALELLKNLSAVAIRLQQRSRNGTGAAGAAAEHAVLAIIDHAGALTVPQIARERFTSRQNIQILVDRLEREGHVELIENPSHKRSALVRLTDSGRRWLAAGAEDQKQLLNQVESSLSQAELGAGVRVLKKLQSVLSGGAQIERPEPVPIQRPKQHVSSAVKRPSKAPDLPTDVRVEEFPVSLL